MTNLHGTTAPAPALVDTTNPAEGFKSLTFKVNFTPEAGLTTPAYTFTYTVAAGEAQPAGAGPEVKAGIGSLTIADVAFAAGDTAKTATIDISGLDFTTAGAGIYRYKITQAAISSDGVAAGILNDKGNGNIEVRFLDLYVNKDGKVIGAVLFKDNTVPDRTTDTTAVANGGALAAVVSNEVPYANKVDSFENTFGKEGNTDPDPDDPSYPPSPADPDDPSNPVNAGNHTVTLTKTIDGNMASKTQVFPFEIKLLSKGLDLTSVKCEIKATAGTPDLTDASITAGTGADAGKFFLVLAATEQTFKVGLKGDDAVEIIVPNNIDVTVQETITTGEGYTVTNVTTSTEAVTLASGFAAQTAKEGETGSKLEDETGLKYALTKKDQDPSITYLNERSQISPTGVVLRFAPYVFMMGAALFLVLFTRRRKDEENA